METQDSFQNRVDLQPLTQGIQAIRDTIGKVIIGQKKTVDLLLVAALADGHVLLEGVPGIAKTLMSKLL
ncbi:MAG: magnesium chelatase, partial [Owenweeksia sp.]